MLILIRQLIMAGAILLGAASSVFGGKVHVDYLGHISVPQVPFEAQAYNAGLHFGYSRGTFCYIPERDSFLMISHPYAQKFAELSNPGPGKRAKIVRDFMDVTQDALAEQERETDSQIHLQATLYDRGRVYLSGEKWYNVTGTHIRTHGSFSANIDSPEFSGWWRVGNWSGQLTGYYMARIPGRLVRNGNWLLTGDRSVVRMTFPWALSPQGHSDLRNACVHGDMLYVSEASAEMFGEEPLPVIHALRFRR